MSLLQVNNLHISFNTSNGIVEAVNGISFTLNNGESVGIVGESGSGKSVTALSLMRLLSGNAKIGGEILFSDKENSTVDLLSLNSEEMRRHRGKNLAMIFQEPGSSLNPVYRCGNQVSEAIVLHKKLSKREAREFTLSLFEKVKLPSPERIYDAYPHQLSGGQKQRVMISMAISCNPAILIADEPTTALDVTVQSSILSLLRELQSEKQRAMLFISHDLGVISEVADRVLIMHNGKIVEHGPVSEIFNSPQHPYTKGLIACRPSLKRKPRILPTIKDFLNENGNVQLNNIEYSREEIQSAQSKLYSRDPILKVEKINVHFPIRRNVFGRQTGTIKAVEDVSFQLFPGETLGLVGESGSGKTTLGRTIARLVSPTSGKIVFDKIDLIDLSRSEMQKMRKRIQFIFQDPHSSLNPKLTVGEVISEPLIVHGLYPGKRKERVLELMNLVNLDSTYINRLPFQLSEGQRQRVCIARALAPQPELIICDEPVSALDVSIQAQILNLLNKLKNEFGYSCIFISHDLSVVKFMSDRIMVMNEGRIVEMAEAEELYSSPKSEYTKMLISSIPGQKLFVTE